MTLSVDAWHEIGEFSRDGATWTRFMEMTLAGPLSADFRQRRQPSGRVSESAERDLREVRATSAWLVTLGFTVKKTMPSPDRSAASWT